MSSGGGKTQTQKVNQDPWKQQQPYLTKLFSQADSLFNKGPIQYYPGETTAQLTPGQTMALDATIDRGLSGSPLNKMAGSEIQKVLGGEYLTQDAPGFQAVANRAREAADATYSGAGRYGSGYHDRAVADSVGNLAFQNYQAERDRMGQAASLAPMIAGQDFVDLNAALAAGGQYQNQIQNMINADIAKYNFQQQAPYANLQAFQDFIQGGYGGSSQTISPTSGPSAAQGALGGALAGAGAGSMFGPWGAGIGAIGGGLFGAFGS